LTDALISETAVVELRAQPTIAVRIQQPMAELDLAAAFDRSLPRVAGRIGELGAAVSGPPFGRYHRYGPDIVDVEIGFPVAATLEALPALAGLAPGEVGASALPEGPAARTILRGPYSNLSAAYDALHAWIHDQPGIDDAAGPWESYLDDPRTVADAADIRTEIVWPVRRTT